MFRTLTRAFVRLEKPSMKNLRCRSSQPRFPQEFGMNRPGYALLVCPLAAFGLGCWQIKRRTWKLELIDELQRRISTPPVELPQDLRELNDMEYFTVRVRGVFDHDEEVYIGPRSDRVSKQIGYFVVTPLKLEDRDYSILVNRGWVPRAQTNPATRREGQVAGVVEIEGVVRKNEPTAIASGEIRSGAIFSTRKIEVIAQLLKTAPVFIDAVEKCSVTGGPVGGQTRVDIRNEHLSYIVTWFTLAVITFFMWFQKYRKVARR